MSAFDPSNGELRLRASLQWHAKVTADLQARIIDARHYVIRNGLDPVLLNILDTPINPSEENPS